MSLEFTLVRRAISLAVIDGPDAGDNPDILKAQGSVLFEPVIKKGDSIQVQTRGGSETYALAPIECPINDGITSHRGQDGVKLPAGGEAANPSLIRWKATFSRMQAGGKSFTLAPVIFDAVPGGEIDLTMVAPVAGAPEGVVRGPRGTSLESIIVDGSELVFTAVDDAGSFEIARIPLDEMVRAEAEAAADGVRDELAVDVAASQSARDAAEGHANRAATSASNAATSETNAKQSETNAGDYAAVATTAATEAVDAMERATEIAGGDFATHEYVDDSIVQFEDSFSAKVVKALQVRRIITSANPDEHLSEGDLLLVTEPLKRLYRRLDSMDGITQRWNVNRWDIATDLPDGESVALHTSGAPERRLASVDAVSGLADVEVVAKIKASAFTPASGSSPSLVLRGSGEAGNETAYSASVGRDSIRMGKFVNGAYTALDSITETIPVGEWFWLRFRVFGPKLQVKIWPDGTPEPAEWRRTTSDSSIEAGGWVGPSATTNSSDLYYHSIGVAALTSEDEQAPTEVL